MYNNWFSTLTSGPDSFLYAAGYIPDGVTWGRVCKIDPENGDLIWDARDTAFYIPGWGSRNRMEGLTVLPSGSTIAVGYTVDYSGHENGLLYKVTKDGCIDTLCTTVGINELIHHPDDQVKVYPNPASQEINFETQDQIHDHTIELFRIDGSLVSRKTLAAGISKFIIDKNQIPPGLYCWRLISSNRVMNSGKIVIIH